MDVEKLALDAGFTENMGHITARHSSGAWVAVDDRLQRFAALVRNAVLEEAEKYGRLICDHRSTEYAHGYNQAALDYEAAIRAMKEVKT